MKLKDVFVGMKVRLNPDGKVYKIVCIHPGGVFLDKVCRGANKCKKHGGSWECRELGGVIRSDVTEIWGVLLSAETRKRMSYRELLTKRK
jgi:hypothetical protein